MWFLHQSPNIIAYLLYFYVSYSPQYHRKGTIRHKNTNTQNLYIIHKNSLKCGAVFPRYVENIIKMHLLSRYKIPCCFCMKLSWHLYYSRFKKIKLMTFLEWPLIHSFIIELPSKVWNLKIRKNGEPQYFQIPSLYPVNTLQIPLY